MLSTLTLAVASLVTWQVTEIWHHSSLFATWRGRAEAAGIEWATCPFCFAQRAAIVITAWLIVAASLSTLPDLLARDMVARLQLIMQWPLYALATARVANVLNDVTRRWCRTPRANRLEPPDDISGNDGISGPPPFLEAWIETGNDDRANDVRDETASTVREPADDGGPGK